MDERVAALNAELLKMSGAQSRCAVSHFGAGHDRELAARAGLLDASLSLSVPLLVDRLRCQTREQIVARAKECSSVIAERSDEIMFKSVHKKDTSALFNTLAEGIACLVLVYGSVTCFGQTFVDLFAGQSAAKPTVLEGPQQ